MKCVVKFDFVVEMFWEKNLENKTFFVLPRRVFEIGLQVLPAREEIGIDVSYHSPAKCFFMILISSGFHVTCWLCAPTNDIYCCVLFIQLVHIFINTFESFIGSKMKSWMT